MTCDVPQPSRTTINTLRTLAMDAVEQAKSGHPGTPMALAPVAYVLWNEFLRYDPAHPLWPARDRFVLSCGHASMLLYGLLHLAGVQQVDAEGEPTGRPAISLDDIRRFRQWESPCAGHPEYGEAAGIETTTGPLGQGVGNSVGMAIASRWLSARYGHGSDDLCGYRVFALCSDGDLMEGIASEAASLAGHLRLGNLCWIYDDNHINIEGDTALAFSEDVGRRFEGMGWRVYSVEDANDLEAIRAALRWFDEDGDDRPALIRLRSVIGYGAPHKAGSHAAHGAPLGPEEVRGAKAFYGWPEDETFCVPEEAHQDFASGLGSRGRQLFDSWSRLWEDYRRREAGSAEELTRIWAGELPENWDHQFPQFENDVKGLATRVSSGKVLNAATRGIPWLLGGSADLAPSNMTALEGEADFEAGRYDGRVFHFGIREHAMAAIANGMAQSGLRPFVATFFVFTDYMRPAMRLAAMMRLPVLYILSHDSIGLGEDGPTHQPVEHLAACRAIPGLSVVRPADAREVVAGYRRALSDAAGPVALVLTRQAVPTLTETANAGAAIEKGGYVLRDTAKATPDVLLMASGSEVAICLEAADRLETKGIAARVISMPCLEWFESQPREYRDDVLPPDVSARVAVEAAIGQGWERYLGRDGVFVGMRGFGASAPYAELYRRFGITSEAVVEAALRVTGSAT